MKWMVTHWEIGRSMETAQWWRQLKKVVGRERVPGISCNVSCTFFWKQLGGFRLHEGSLVEALHVQGHKSHSGRDHSRLFTGQKLMLITVLPCLDDDVTGAKHAVRY